jgi:predicted amidohydrolase YtcJ
MRVPIFVIAAALILGGCSTGPTMQSIDNNSLVISNATVITGNGDEVLRGATIVVRDGRIASIHRPGEPLTFSAGRTVDGSTMTVLPGLVDAHAHIGGLGAAMATVSLVGAKSEAEMISRIVERAKTLPPGTWVTGRGWDQNDWPGRNYPTAAALDAAVPDHPVWMRRIDGHAGLANSAAMRAAGLTRDSIDPEGGKIIRSTDGSPEGVLIDNAMALVEKAIPEVSRDEKKRRLIAATTAIAATGLTGVHEAGVSDEDIELYKELADEGRLPIRVNLWLNDDDALLDRWFARGPLVGYRDLVTVRAVKLYADGALGSRGAAMLAPYSDDADNSGLLVTPPERIADVTRRARAAGFQVNTHAIGDRGNRVVFEAYEKAGIRPGERHRIEHVQVVALDDIPRFAKDGVIASMQPTHATSDMPWAEDRVGAERIRGAYAWRSILDSGAVLAFGSDFPIEGVNPFLGIYAAVTRQDADGHPPEGWTAQERLSLYEAIAGFSSAAAYAAFEEESRGRIEEGKFADFTIIEGDLTSTPVSQIDDAVVRYTIVNGAIVYERN